MMAPRPVSMIGVGACSAHSSGNLLLAPRVAPSPVVGASSLAPHRIAAALRLAVLSLVVSLLAPTFVVVRPFLVQLARATVGTEIGPGSRPELVARRFENLLETNFVPLWSSVLSRCCPG